MKILLNIFMFLVVLFVYIHLVSQYKKSQDLEIYEIDYKNNLNLQEVCDMKQPFLFEFESIYPKIFDSINYNGLENFPNFDVKLKDTNDYFKKNGESNNVEYVVLPFQSAFKLIDTDTNKHFFIENNLDYVEESPYYSIYTNCDSYFKPVFTAQTKYDLCIGSRGSYTPLRYHTGYRNFICINSGKIQIKMTPWRSYKYLHVYHNYDDYEFVSNINPWTPQMEYINDFQKIKFLEFQVSKGNVIYIPPYWFYSIKYEEDTVCSGFVYNSVMNMLSNSHHYMRYYLQQGIKKKVLKHIDTNNDNNTGENISDISIGGEVDLCKTPETMI